MRSNRARRLGLSSIVQRLSSRLSKPEVSDRVYIGSMEGDRADDASEYYIGPFSTGHLEHAGETDTLSLGKVVGGRMFCLRHGRECYKRDGILDSCWICPDERHQIPIK